MDSNYAATATHSSSSSSNSAAANSSKDWVGSLAAVENPFVVKVGQVFTGFGVGCGVGIGVGRPIYLGSDGDKRWKPTGSSDPCAIPALQQVLVATRGATDIFSSAGRHLNSSLRKLGAKGVEAGVGCGIGFGHGFGVGLAIKPSTLQRLQSCLALAVVKVITKLGMAPGIHAIQGIIPTSLPSSTHALTGKFDGALQTSVRSSLQRPTTESILPAEINNGSSFLESKTKPFDSKGMLDMPIASRTEKVISSFLQNPLLKNEEDTELNELAGKLRSENNVLQVLMKHQQVIDKLVEENEKLRKILIEDLKISPSKLQTSEGSWTSSNNPCSQCFDCRRKRRTR